MGHITAGCLYQHTSLAITVHVLQGPSGAIAGSKWGVFQMGHSCSHSCMYPFWATLP